MTEVKNRTAFITGGANGIYRLDIRDRAEYAHIADSVENKLGPVSLLFNNAGVVLCTAIPPQ
jgi:NAD(P)-dependent dehydrogenase (short-subunit alcohol dehydrogenase family)